MPATTSEKANKRSQLELSFLEQIVCILAERGASDNAWLQPLAQPVRGLQIHLALSTIAAFRERSRSPLSKFLGLQMNARPL